MFFPEPDFFLKRNKNIVLHEKSVNFIQILPKFIVETGGSDYSFFAFFRTRYVFCKIWEHIFFKQKTYPPPL